MKHFQTIVFMVLFSFVALSQSDKKAVKISGTLGTSYDYYGLSTNPNSPSFYNARRPWNMVRFNLNPLITYGDFKIPININISPTTYGFNGIGGYWPPSIPRPKQTFGQWITNPINNIGINPSYKWAELQLGTQYLRYSPLSTGDFGVFGAGVSLKPGNFRFKFFHGISQQRQDPIFTPAPGVLGIYKRYQTMAQIGFEKKDSYFAGFNIVRSKDVEDSILPIPAINKPPHPDPQEGVVVTFMLNLKNENGWFFNTELGNSYHSRDINNTSAPLVTNGSFKGLVGFIKPRISTAQGFATQTSVGKKSKNFDIGLNGRFFSKGYYTAGYPFLQNDRLDFTIKTRVASNDRKYIFNGDIGQRFTNWSGTRNRQLIANANMFAQFTEQFSLNGTYNNFGFQAPAFGSFMGMRNVANDLSINPTYIWSNASMSNIVSATYSWSKFDETVLPNPSTTNNTQSVLLLYVPVFYNRSISPDFSVMWFENNITPTNINLRLYTATAGASMPLKKPKMTLKGQLQYTNTKLQAFTPNNNFLATVGFKWPVTNRLTWNLAATVNFLKYGDELTPPNTMLGANYTESHVKASIQYRLGE